ncbi:MAG: hypothetical protein IJS44_06690 [Clostridia bacterium]|nr:hypothetical protein [Clostridia bacterium]
MKKTKQRDSEKTVFYSRRGVATLAAFVALFTIISLVGMYALGVIKLPAALTALFADETSAVSPAHAGEDIPLPPQNRYETAVPLSEYAAALSEIELPKGFYQTYTVTRGTGKNGQTLYYTFLQNGNDYWVQTASGSVILSTVVCKDGQVRLTDHSRNEKATVGGALTAEEAAGVLSLAHLLEMMRAAATDTPVDYGGGLSNYSLSISASRGEGDNLFTFAFTTGDGVSERYTFSPERGVLLSGEKTYGGKVIYSMQSTGFTDDLSEIDLDLLFAT